MRNTVEFGNVAVKYAPQYVSVITKSLLVIKQSLFVSVVVFFVLFSSDSQDFCVTSGSD